MSEYQYYEFQAIDRPLTEKEQSFIASLSSRVVLTPHHAIFTYSFGDFRGDAKKVLLDYFDAMLYLANWGTKRLAFRLPRSVVEAEMIAPYCVEDIISTRVIGEYILLDIRFDDEDWSDWIEGEGWLSSLLPLRQDILRGDFRALYLAWLKAISLEPEFEDEDPLEPPLPAGLRALSRPLKKFVELFEIDEDFIEAASEISPEQESAAEPEVEKLVVGLSDEERNDFLIRLARGESNLDIQLIARLRKLDESKSAVPTLPRRTVTELIAAAGEKERSRRERKRQEAEKARIKRLNEMSKREPQMWDEVFALIAKKQPKAYDDAIRLLVDLRDLAEHLGQPERFQSRINGIYEQYSNRPGLLDRMRRARLLKQEA
ncbi:MAG: hypothetical protein AB1631_23065 [Acidobacteriota bacterium]